ncbi:MAG: hypothetical protein R3E96_10235 [Planctomycetota bacterium]
MVAAPLAAATQGELHRRERDRAQGATLMAMAKVAEMRQTTEKPVSTLGASVVMPS